MPPRARAPLYFDRHDDMEPEPRSPEDLIHEIASLLHGRRDSAEFVEVALMRLSPFIALYTRELVAEGVAEEAVGAMRRHLNTASVIKIIFKFLLTLLHDITSPTYGEVSATVLGCGGVEATLSAMRHHGQNDMIQGLGYYLLCNFSTIKDAGTLLIREGGFAIIVGAMAKSCGDSNLQQTGCAAICHLLNHDSSETYKETMEELGAVPVIIETLKRHDSSKDGVLCLICACGAIGMLAEDCESVKTAVAELDGIPAILGSMSHGTSKNGTELPCSALLAIFHLITGRNDIKKLFVAADGIGVVTSMMIEHSDTANVVAAACLLFATLVMNTTPDIVDSVMSNGVLGVTVSAMERHSDNNRILCNACIIIGSCAQCGSVGMKWAIRSTPNVVDHVIESMRRHAENEKLQEVAVAALSHLSRDDVGLGKDILMLDGLAAMAAAMNQFTHNDIIPSVSCAALKNLANYDGVAAAIKASGFVPALLFASRLHSDNDDIIMQALETLLVVASVDTDIDDDVVVVSSDVGEFLVSIHQAKSNSNKHVSTVAADLLSRLKESRGSEVCNSTTKTALTCGTLQ